MTYCIFSCRASCRRRAVLNFGIVELHMWLSEQTVESWPPEVGMEGRHRPRERDRRWVGLKESRDWDGKVGIN